MNNFILFQSSSFISGQTSPGIGFRTPQTHLKEQKRKGKTESILKWYSYIFLVEVNIKKIYFSLRSTK